jgi:hypothetical protein
LTSLAVTTVSPTILVKNNELTNKKHGLYIEIKRYKLLQSMLEHVGVWRKSDSPSMKTSKIVAFRKDPRLRSEY